MSDIDQTPTNLILWSLRLKVHCRYLLLSFICPSVPAFIYPSCQHINSSQISAEITYIVIFFKINVPTENIEMIHFVLLLGVIFWEAQLLIYLWSIWSKYQLGTIQSAFIQVNGHVWNAWAVPWRLYYRQEVVTFNKWDPPLLEANVNFRRQRLSRLTLFTFQL